MKIVFQINGGIGKVISSTAVVRAIKKQYPDHKIITVSGYPDVFLNNPNVDRSYAFGQLPYFYEEHIENQDNTLVFAHDPYLDNNFIKQGMHLTEVWCKMFGIQHDGDLPELFLTEREVNYYIQKFQSDKPILVMQTNGGSENPGGLKYSWARDIPSKVVLEVIEEFQKDYNIVHIRREDQLSYPGVSSVTDTFRSLVTLISVSTKRLFMDSFAQHTAAALRMPSTVLWIANKPQVFGYENHQNIVANPFTKQPELRNSYLSKFNIAGEPLEFPYNSEADIFDTQKVIESLKN